MDAARRRLDRLCAGVIWHNAAGPSSLGKWTIGQIQSDGAATIVENEPFSATSTGLVRYDPITRLYATMTRVNCQSILGRPRCRALRSPATVLVQLNASSLRLRMRWLTA